MSDGAWAFSVGLIVGVILMAFIMFCCSVPNCTYADIRAKAVELHAAEWVVNPKDGTTTFTWKDAKP